MVFVSRLSELVMVGICEDGLVVLLRVCPCEVTLDGRQSSFRFTYFEFEQRVLRRHPFLPVLLVMVQLS